MSYGAGANPLMQAFWSHVRERRLVVQECARCSNLRFPPTAVCPQCLSTDLRWREASGRGRVESVVTFHQRYWDDRPVPYDVYLVKLEEGPLMMSNVVNGYSAPKIGDAVTVIFEQGPEDRILPQFVLEVEAGR